jgi:hypothetical protein
MRVTKTPQGDESGLCVICTAEEVSSNMVLAKVSEPTF